MWIRESKNVQKCLLSLFFRYIFSIASHLEGFNNTVTTDWGNFSILRFLGLQIKYNERSRYCRPIFNYVLITLIIIEYYLTKQLYVFIENYQLPIHDWDQLWPELFSFRIQKYVFLTFLLIILFSFINVFHEHHVVLQ